MNIKFWCQYLSIAVFLGLIFREVKYGNTDDVTIVYCIFISILLAGIACFIKEEE